MGRPGHVEGLLGLAFYRFPGNALMVQTRFWMPDFVIERLDWITMDFARGDSDAGRQGWEQ